MQAEILWDATGAKDIQLKLFLKGYILHQRVDELAVPDLRLEYLQIDHHSIYPRCISCELLDQLPLKII